MIIAVIILALMDLILIFLLFRRSKPRTEETKEEPPKRYSDLFYRVERVDDWIFSVVDKYYAVIYTILPYEKKILMRTGEYYTREEAKEEAELIIKSLKK